MSAYYNELDPKAAAWLRELIRCGHIAKGEVDERSILEVSPADLRGFTQCHFFAGIGVWSYALRLAGWADDRPVWTGSCPCQPFSAAGKGEGYADERHLWPHWNRLISECRPSVIFGEQVDAAIRTGWLDDVCLSLESLGYAVGAVSFPACSVGAPHIRQRLYFVADAGCSSGCAEHRDESRSELGWGPTALDVAGVGARGAACELADSERAERRALAERGTNAGRRDGNRAQGSGGLERGGADGRMEHTDLPCASNGELQRRGEVGRATETDGASSTRIVGHPSQRGLEIDGGAPGDAGQIGEQGRDSVVWRGVGIRPGNGATLRGRDNAGSELGELVDSKHTERRSFSLNRQDERDWHNDGRAQAHREFGTRSEVCGLADATDARCDNAREHGSGLPSLPTRSGEHGGMGDANGEQRERPAERPKSSGWPGSSHAGAVNGFWTDAVWIPCRDGKARPTEPGSFPLVTGAPARVVRLRGYGNAINAQQAKEFILAFRDVTE